MVTKVTYETIESQPFNNIFEIIDTRSNIADPRDVEGKKIRKFVYDSDPFSRSIDFNLLPYIIVEIPKTEDVRENTSINGEHHLFRWSHRIVVRTARNGSANQQEDIGRTDMFNICNDLRKTFNSNSIKKSLKDVGIINISLNKTSQDTLTDSSGNEIYEAEFMLEYEYRMKVVA